MSFEGIQGVVSEGGYGSGPDMSQDIQSEAISGDPLNTSFGKLDQETAEILAGELNMKSITLGQLERYAKYTDDPTMVENIAAQILTLGNLSTREEKVKLAKNLAVRISELE